MYEIRTAGDGREVRSWATDIEENTMEQALRSARSDAVSGPIALMPDAHWGLGATVGSVIPTESAIIPAAVGVDIGCGMIAVETDLGSADLPDDLTGLLGRIERSIPSGFGRHEHPGRAADEWMAAHRLPDPDVLPTKAQRTAAQQIGTLGGGNHFVEVCLDEEERVWCVLHSGSRGIGNQLARVHIDGAKRLCKDLERATEDRDLAYFLDSDAEFGRYIEDMLWAQGYALENREQMMNALIAKLEAELDRPVAEHRRINCHHNYTERETHDGRELWITRKGAIRAQTDDLGVIPGSMGTGTFIVRGLGNDASYRSASHGAGRRHGRKDAKRRFSAEQLTEAMAGRTWQAEHAEQLIDESPMAYKDIDSVMADQADLVEVEARLEAILNYKGV